MNRFVLAFILLIFAQLLPAQDVTYVVFNRDCMNQMVYRYAYPNMKGDDPVYAYSIRPNVLENYVFLTEGAGHYSPTRPDDAISCKNLNLSDGFIGAVNRGDKQMLIVFQRQEGGYWLMPVASATLVARSGAKYWVRSKNCSFTFDTLRMENDMNLAVAGSPTAVYFKGAQVRNCLMEYSFHCESVKGEKLRSDIELIPSIGFTTDRSGGSSAKALENEMQLSRINASDIDDYIGQGCPEEAKISVSKTQKPAEYGYDKETYGYSEVDKETASIRSNKPAEYNYDGQKVAINCPEKLGDGYHVVQKGDNLRGIARTYGVDVASLVKWNKLKDPNKIEICQVIWYKKPPANAEKLTKPAEKPVEHNTADYKVVDQRKISKISSAKGGDVRPQVYSNEDENYDTWRQKPQVTTKTPEKPQAYEYYDEDATSDERPLVHTIKKGEYLYKLAQTYKCPEECIRQANDMPAEGDVEFRIGQKVIIPKCDCLKKVASKSTPYEEPVNTASKKKKIQSSLLNPEQYNTEDPDPQTEGKKDLIKKGVEDEWPIEDKYDTKTTTVKKTGSKKAPETKVPQFREHLARQGDTIRSIATKYKVDPAELAQVNGMGLNEAIVPGKWILVPIEEE